MYKPIPSFPNALWMELDEKEGWKMRKWYLYHTTIPHTDRYREGKNKIMPGVHSTCIITYTEHFTLRKLKGMSTRYTLSFLGSMFQVRFYHETLYSSCHRTGMLIYQAHSLRFPQGKVLCIGHYICRTHSWSYLIFPSLYLPVWGIVVWYRYHFRIF